MSTKGEAQAETVWVLADDRAGNVAQCLGVAEALGLPFVVKPIRYKRTAALPNLLKGASRIGLDAETRALLVPPWPRVVIAAGRRTAPAARWIKRRAKAVAVQIMNPGNGLGSFDLVVVPSHDRRLPTGANILPVVGAPHRVTAERLAAEAELWRERLAHLPRPWVALIVGGATRRRPFPADAARALGTAAAAFAIEAGGSLLVTTSRRTGAEAEAALLSVIPEPNFIYRWNDGGPNPYFGFLGLADAIIVTGDSVSMASEACATDKPVYIFAPEGLVAPKHARLHRELFRLGLARPLGEAYSPWRHPPLNPAGEVAAAIRRLL